MRQGDDNKQFPTFLVIGADPYDVDWLRRNLSEHPQVHVAPAEIAFFSHRKRLRALGRDWYAAQFHPAANETTIGEATVQYMLQRNSPALVAKRIANTLPDVKLIAVLRNPIDRLLLEWQSRVLAGQVDEETLFERLDEDDPLNDPLGLVANGLYAALLRQYVRTFGDRLLVVTHEEIRDDPRAVYEQVLRHLGADASYVPARVATVNSPEPQRSSIAEEQLARLRACFNGDVAHLERMLGREFEQWPEFVRPRIVLWTGEWQLPRNWERASAWVGQLIANTGRDQFGVPTPCAAWDVAHLLEHMVVDLRLAVETLAGAPLEWDSDIVREPARAFESVSGRFLEAVADVERFRNEVTVDGEVVSGHFFAYARYMNQILHGWDLAVATGQDAEIPREILATMERVARPFLEAMPRRPEIIGPPFEPPADATATEVFIALAGRDPLRWRSGDDARTAADAR